MLIIFATDGAPDDRNSFFKILKDRDGMDPSMCPTVIMACTDDDSAVGWLNQLDKGFPFIDVVDDYLSERQEILKMQGEGFPFSKGDYLVKTLIGCIDPLYDTLDEKRLTKEQYLEYCDEDQPPYVAPATSPANGRAAAADPDSKPLELVLFWLFVIVFVYWYAFGFGGKESKKYNTW